MAKSNHSPRRAGNPSLVNVTAAERAASAEVHQSRALIVAAIETLAASVPAEQCELAQSALVVLRGLPARLDRLQSSLDDISRESAQSSLPLGSGK